MESASRNASFPNDVDENQGVNPLDVLRVINAFNRTGFRNLPDAKPAEELYCDVNGDQRIDPTDILAIINAINRTRQPSFVHSSIVISQNLNRNSVVLKQDVLIRGTTNPMSFVDASDPSSNSFRVVADLSGRFEFPLRLPTGLHGISITVMDDLGRQFPMVTQVRVGTVMQEWNNAVLNAFRDWRGVTDDPAPGTLFTSEPPRFARNLAMIQDGTHFLFDGTAGLTAGYSIDQLVYQEKPKRSFVRLRPNPVLKTRTARSIGRKRRSRQRG